MRFVLLSVRAAGLLTFLLLAMVAEAEEETPLKTIDDRVKEFGESVRARLEPFFRAAGVTYPPSRLTFIGLKQERLLQVYAAEGDRAFHFIRAYPVLAASGGLGPKLREGDLQVPEGIYRLRELNPNSRFHLSLWLNYPNEFDRARAAQEGRTDLGGEIMIHGDAVSTGCLAMGDSAAEDLFVLAALTGIDQVTVLLAPRDFRQGATMVIPDGAPTWSAELYEMLGRELAKYCRESRSRPDRESQPNEPSFCKSESHASSSGSSPSPTHNFSTSMR